MVSIKDTLSSYERMMKTINTYEKLSAPIQLSTHRFEKINHIQVMMDKFTQMGNITSTTMRNIKYPLNDIITYQTRINNLLESPMLKSMNSPILNLSEAAKISIYDFTTLAVEYEDLMNGYSNSIETDGQTTVDAQEVIDIAQEIEKGTITKEQLRKILGTIFSIFTFLCTMIGFFQEQTIIKQNQIIIEQNQQESLQTQQLIDVTEELTDATHKVANIYEILAEEVENITNTSQVVDDNITVDSE